jgi:acetyl esterase/lipase
MAIHSHLLHRIVINRARLVRRSLCLCFGAMAFACTMTKAQETTTPSLPEANPETPPASAGVQTNPAIPKLPPSVEVKRDIVYVQRGNHALKLDLYSSPGSTPQPLAIWIHGGGWRLGSKDTWVNPLFLATNGFTVASIEYRLSQEALFPAQIEDSKAAVRFLRANAATYNLDPNRFAAIGESAGGNLVSLLGTTGGSKNLTDAPDSPVSDQVQAVIDLFGPADLSLQLPPLSEEKNGTAPYYIHKLIGHTYDERPDLYLAGSPIHYISSTTPPFLILHGEGDPVCPVAQSLEFFAALQKAGISSALIVVPVSYHAGPAFWTAEKQQRMISFLQNALKIPTASGVAETDQGKSEK